jgi:GH35 family endo-1,4-beta-xylanase
LNDILINAPWVNLLFFFQNEVTMNHSLIKNASCWILAVALSGTFFGTAAAVPASLASSTDAAIETLRKRDCSITVNGTSGSPLSEAAVSVQQVRHDFGFGAAIPYSILSDTSLQKVFLDHFEWAVFENDLKWPETDPTPDGPDYTRPDELLAFCQANDIKVRAHNLFWNQDSAKIPEWTRALSTTDFLAAVDARITNALTHYKGKVEQWDVGNEVIHGTVFETKTGNSGIWNYIFNKCRGIDETVKLAINDFNIVEQYSDVDKYVTKIKATSNIDVIGVEGHFGSSLVQSDYKTKLDKVATVGKPIWFTEVDFSVATSVRCDRFEELLRTAFANAKVEGFTMWVFWQGNRWRSDLTSYIADSATYAINDLGRRYESLLKLWTTAASGTTDAGGKYAFRGFQGKYVVTTTAENRTQTDTVYLEPGQGAKNLTIAIRESGITVARATVSTSPTVCINGRPITFKNVTIGKEPLFVSMYSTSGRLLSRRQIDRNGKGTLPKVPTGFYLLGIGTFTHTFSTVGISLP